MRQTSRRPAALVALVTTLVFLLSGCPSTAADGAGGGYHVSG